MQAILALGATLAVLAALVRTWAAAYLRSELVHDWKIHSEDWWQTAHTVTFAIPFTSAAYYLPWGLL